MPQTASAKKALRASARQRVVNDRWRRKVRSTIKQVRSAIQSGQKTAADQAFTLAQKTLDRAARHHVITQQSAARKKSRLKAAIAQLA